MPRPNRRRRDEVPLDLDRAVGGGPRREQHPDGEWLVRKVSGATSRSAYRCPGCQQEIPVGVPHLVAWPGDGVLGLDERRHWHTACWSARHRRRPGGSWK